MSPLLSARTILCLLALLSSFSGGAGWAQDAAVLPGSRVRVWTGLNDNGRPTGPRRTGQMALWTADSLVLDLAGPRNQLSIPTTSVSRVEVSFPRSPRSGALRMGSIGLLIGAATGAVFGYQQGSDWLFSARDNAFIYGSMFGGAGTFVGLIAGAISPGERWERVPLPSRVSTERAGWNRANTYNPTPR